MKNNLLPTYHIKLKDVIKDIGFTVATIPSESYGWLLVKGFFNSDQEEFHTYISHICSIYLNKYVWINNLTSFLIIIHDDNTADIYLNNLPIIIKVRPKRDLKRSEIIKKKDIVDINELRFKGINIKENDNIVFCFKVGWKFGLYFDFYQGNGTKKIDIEELYKDLGRYYRYITFQNEYSILKNKKVFNRMLNDGWFPFIQLIGGDFEKLSIIYEEEKYFDSLLQDFIKQFDKNRIYSFVNKWWKNKYFEEKQPLLEAGINAYLKNSQEGFINCIKTLFSEIEGIFRLAYFNEYNKEPKFKELIKFISEKAVNSFGSDDSLGFPGIFYKYADEVIFKSFNLKKKDIELSRHSTSHGVAKTEKYTKPRALQLILILDQMFFFIS